MLYWLIQPLSQTFIGFNVFRYLTFRTGLAIATAFFISPVSYTHLTLPTTPYV